jgi:hypothetical protein
MSQKVESMTNISVNDDRLMGYNAIIDNKNN